MDKQLVVISAVWCPSCLNLNKHLKKFLSEYPNITMKKLDYDLDEEELLKYKIGNKLPVIIMIDKSGNEIGRLVGETKYDEIIEFVMGSN